MACKHHAVSYDESTDLVTCDCGEKFEMHYSDPNAFTWDDSPEVECTTCLRAITRKLYKALNEANEMLRQKVLAKLRGG